jgi:TonB dependent receptor
LKRDFWLRSISAAALVMGAGVVVAAVPSAAYAEDTAGVQGVVQGAAGGAVVEAVNTATGERRTAAIREDGAYTLVGLRPGRYRIKAGDGDEQDVSLAVGTTTTLDLSATAGGGSEIVVVGRLRETRTAEIATSVSQIQIESLPQNDRNFLNFAALAPGVSLSTDPFRKTFQAGALSANNVNVFIDGQSYKGQVQQGGIAGQDSSQGNPFPQLAVQEFKVATQNYPAELEFAGSAVITAVTKTGGEEFHGTIFGEFVPDDWYGRPYFQRDDAVQPAYERQQFGLDFGGPIIKNRLHFYVAYEGARQLNPGTTVDITNTAVDASIRDRENGAFERDFNQDLYFGKLTWFLNEQNTIDFTAYDRQEARLDDFGGNRTFAGARDVDNKVSNYLIDWNYNNSAFLLETSLARQEYTWTTPLHDPSITQETVLQSVNTNNDTDPTNDNLSDVAIFGQAFVQTSSQETLTWKQDITFATVAWNGDHVFRAGYKVAENTYDRVEGNILPTYRYDAVLYGATGANVDPRSARVANNPTGLISTDNRQYGLYVMDDWSFGEHWTLNLGLRWDYEDNMLNNDYVTPANIANALRTNAGFIAAGFNPEDYISNGSNREGFKDAWQPRIGVSYDVGGDGETVLFAGWGRFYDRTLFNSAQLEERQAVSGDQNFNFCGAQTGATCQGVIANGRDANGYYVWNDTYNDPSVLLALAAASGSIPNSKFLNNDTKVPFTDQFNVGLRHYFGDMLFSITYANNKSFDGFEYVRGNRYPDGTYTPLGDGFIFDNHPYGLGGLNGARFEVGTNGKKTRYEAVYLSLDKPLTEETSYGFTATLTLADTAAIGMVGGDDNFTAANSMAYGYTDAAGVDKVRFVGTAIVRGPWDTLFSTNIIYGSGQAFGTVDATGTIPAGACCRANFNGVYFPDDNYNQVDLRAAKNIELPNGHVVTIDGQVFNVFDTVNRAYSAWGAGSNWGGGPPLREDNTQGPARTFQAGIRYKW